MKNRRGFRVQLGTWDAELPFAHVTPQLAAVAKNPFPGKTRCWFDGKNMSVGDVAYRYSHLLQDGLRRIGVSPKQALIVARDVVARLSLLGRWGDSMFRDIILLPSVEEALFYEPSSADLKVRCLVNACVRNSLLEDLHAETPWKSDLCFRKLGQEEMKVLTAQAVRYFSMLDMESLPSSGRTVYDDLPNLFPKAWEALGCLAAMRGLEMMYDPTNRCGRGKMTMESSTTGILRKSCGVVCESGINPEFGGPLMRAVRGISMGSGVFLAGSFKGVSRNLEKLLCVINCLLENDARFVTYNYLFSPGFVCRRKALLKAESFLSSGAEEAAKRIGMLPVHAATLDFARKSL